MYSRLLPLGFGALLLGTIPAMPHGPLWDKATAAVKAGPSVAYAIPMPGVPTEAVSRAPLPMADSALVVLGGKVVRQSDASALRMAFQAYYAYRAAHPERIRNPYLYYVDYGLDNRTPRGYVFDMDQLTLVDGPFTVAHGRGSSAGRDGVPVRFSNASGSNASSLGLFLTREMYGFTGRSGGRPYASVGMRLEGLSGGFNDDAYARGVVVHGAPYVTPVRAGRSEGCPAMEPWRARKLIPMIADGGLVFLFSPANGVWIHNDPWAGSAAVLAHTSPAATTPVQAATAAVTQATSPLTASLSIGGSR